MISEFSHAKPPFIVSHSFPWKPPLNFPQKKGAMFCGPGADTVARRQATVHISPLRRQLRSLGEAGLKLGPVRQQRRAGGRHGQKTTEGILVEVVEVWRSSNGKSAIFNGKITIFNGKIHYKGPYYSVIICIDIVSGWWLTYPSEKYESQWEGLSHISGWIIIFRRSLGRFVYFKIEIRFTSQKIVNDFYVGQDIYIYIYRDIDIDRWHFHSTHLAGSGRWQTYLG